MGSEMCIRDRPYLPYAGDEDLIAKLVQVGLLKPEGDGFTIVGFLGMNPSREEVDVLREKRRRAGSQGGRATKAARAVADGAAKVQQASAPYPYPDPLLLQSREGPEEPSATKRLVSTEEEREEEDRRIRAMQPTLASKARSEIEAAKEAALAQRELPDRTDMDHAL